MLSWNSSLNWNRLETLGVVDFKFGNWIFYKLFYKYTWKTFLLQLRHCNVYPHKDLWKFFVQKHPWSLVITNSLVRFSRTSNTERVSLSASFFLTFHVSQSRLDTSCYISITSDVSFTLVPNSMSLWRLKFVGLI